MAPQPAAELRLILDSGAVIAVAAGKPRVRSRFEEFRDQCIAVIVPAAVIAEVIRGGPGDATVNRFLKTIDEVSAVTERTARRAVLSSPRSEARPRWMHWSSRRRHSAAGRWS